MIYGYARVSSKGQDKYGNGLDIQEQQLRDAGAVEIFHESFTGTTKNRPELDKLLNIVHEGDTLVVTKLDRIARSTKDGIDIIDTLLTKGVNIHILNIGNDIQQWLKTTRRNNNSKIFAVVNYTIGK